MAGERALFYNSVNGDRTYSADSFSDLFGAVYSSGVAKNFGSEMAVSVSGPNTLTVGTGAVLLGGKALVCKTPTTIPVTSATLSGYAGKVAYVVAERDDDSRNINLRLVGSSSLQNDESRPEHMTLVLAEITVNNGAASLQDNANVTLEMNSARFMTERISDPGAEYDERFDAKWNAFIQKATADGSISIDDVASLLDMATAAKNDAAEASNAAGKAAADMSSIKDILLALGMTDSSGKPQSTMQDIIGSSAVSMTRVWTPDPNEKSDVFEDQLISIPDGYDAFLVKAVVGCKETVSASVLKTVVSCIVFPGEMGCLHFSLQGNDYNRFVTWVTDKLTVTYKTDNKKLRGATKASAAVREFGPGLYFGWGFYGSKGQGNLYTHYNAVDWDFKTEAEAEKLNTNNLGVTNIDPTKNTKNAQSNCYMIPTEIYGIKGIRKPEAEEV